MEYLSISRMAKMHNLSRQTLIYYDKIGLFKPHLTDEKGYRFYSELQIPFLREICFLKSIGISLKGIKAYFQEREPQKIIALLNERKEAIIEQINKLDTIKEHIQQRINLHETVVGEKYPLNTPFLETFPERHVLYEPFPEPPYKVILHRTLLKLFQIVHKHNLTLANGFGTLLLKESLETDNLLAGAGAYVFLPVNHKIKNSNLKTAAPGIYACFSRYGMPYETEALEELLTWIKANNYQIIGDVLDACLLDTTFYRADKKVDFCMLQIPVKK